ncbi:MAG TPA: hypothetical protein VK868_09930, partial [Pyrinomonadaceae bacterium]|nr:hypothetical protein [Pyrinomonadaceae bacterium]
MSSLWIFTDPPWASTVFFTASRPAPRPEIVEASDAVEKPGSKSRPDAMSSGSMPRPSSVTRM